MFLSVSFFVLFVSMSSRSDGSRQIDCCGFNEERSVMVLCKICMNLCKKRRVSGNVEAEPKGSGPFSLCSANRLSKKRKLNLPDVMRRGAPQSNWLAAAIKSGQ